LYNFRTEIRHIQITMYIKNITISLALLLARLQLFFGILSYVLLGNYISAQKVTNKFNYFLNMTIFYLPIINYTNRFLSSKLCII